MEQVKLSRRKFFVGGTVALAAGIIEGVHTKTPRHVITKPVVSVPVAPVLSVHDAPVPVMKKVEPVIVHHKKKMFHFPKFTRHTGGKVKLSKYDRNVLIKTIWGETRGESAIGRMAVVHVILNRKYKENPFFKKSKTISQLCLKKYQFSCWLDKFKMNHIKVDDTYKDIEKEVNEAIHAYESGYDYSNRALFYYSDIIDPPNWAGDYKLVNKIGLHNFMA